MMTNLVFLYENKAFNIVNKRVEIFTEYKIRVK